MSEVRLLVREAKGSWSGTIHGSIADIAIAALSADPVTLRELEAGMARFTSPLPAGRPLSNLFPGSADEPHEEVLVTHWPKLKMYDFPIDDIFRKIHADWLLTPRSDLHDLCPRDWAVRQCSHIDWDLQHRWQQWSHQGECPPPLEESTHAYKFGDFGTNELVVYYELVRDLLNSSWQQLSEMVQASETLGKREIASVEEFLVTEVDRLAMVLEEWLDTPHPEYHLRTPRSIIHHERVRIPETLSPSEAIIDPDCPCCQMLADMPGPALWGLDGANMDDEFAFDISCRTREEWEASQRQWEEEYRNLEAEHRERERLGLSISSDSDSNSSSVWTASFSVDDSPDLPLGIRTFRMGCRLAEVISDLRYTDGQETSTPEVQRVIDRLNRDFGNLRHVLQNTSDTVSEALLQPIISHFVDTIADVAREYPKVTQKCEVLTSHLEHFLEQPPEGEAGFLDVPY